MNRKQLRRWLLDVILVWDNPEEAKSMLLFVIDNLTTNQEKRRIEKSKLMFNQKLKENGKNKAGRTE